MICLLLLDIIVSPHKFIVLSFWGKCFYPLVKTHSPILAFPKRTVKTCVAQAGVCVFRAQLRLRTFYFKEREIMRKPIKFICLLCIILTLFGCSHDYKGVPDSVVLREAESQVENYTNYKINHKIDTAAHIDDIELELYNEGAYGTETIATSYSYQYNKATDLWTLLQAGDFSYKYVIDENAYISSSPCTGAVNGPYSFNYSISFEAFNADTHMASISYMIDFDGSIHDYEGQAAINIDYNSGTSAPSFTLLVEFYVANLYLGGQYIPFNLTIDGLKPAPEYS